MTKLYDAYTFRCGAAVKNRVVLAPLTNTQSHSDGTLGEGELRWLERRAAGGYGITTTCAAWVAPDGKGFDGQLGAGGDEHLDGLKRLAKALAKFETLGIAQLVHGGARAPSRLTGTTPWSATTWTEESPNFEPPRPATESDIERVIGQFRMAALRANKAGFAGVELHGAHGYLLSQFLSRAFNTRRDRWGGAELKNRARLIREVTREVRGALPKRAIVGVRLSPEDRGFAKGLDLDETIQVARWLAAEGVDYIHLSLWDYTKNSAKYPDKHPLPLFREALPPEVAVIAAGNIWTGGDTEKVFALGADFVALGKSAILNPDWPKHAGEADWAPERGPLTPAQLAELSVSPAFVEYLRKFKTIVKE